MRPEPLAPADGDIARHLSALRRHKLLIGATIIVSLALCLGAILSLRPLYRAEAAIVIDPRQTNIVDVKSVVPGFDLTSTAGSAIITTQTGILRGEPLIREVIERLHLANDPRFLRRGDYAVFRWSFLRAYVATYLARLSPAAPADRDDAAGAQAAAGDDHEKALAAAVAQYRGDLKVENDGRSFIITVEFKSTDKELAARVANTHAQIYLERQQQERTRLEETASQWLGGQNTQLKDDVVRAEQAVQQYRQQHRLVALPGGDGRPTSELQQQVVDLNTQLGVARADGAQKAAEAEALRRILRSPNSSDAMQSVSQIVSSPLIDQLRAQEAEVLRREAALTTNYGDKYPTVRNVRNELQSIRGKIRQEVDKIATSVAHDAMVARAREASLRSSLAKLGHEAAEQNGLEIKLGGLEQEADAARDVYHNFLNRQKEIAAQLGLQQPDARVVAAATVPQRPYFPNAVLLLSLTLAASALTGIGLSLVADRFARGFRSSGQVEELCGVPVFGTLSALKSGLFRRKAPADQVVDHPSSVFAEQLHEIRFACQAALGRDSSKILLVTSCLPNEGKSVLALSLARALALGGHSVLLCDCDLRRSSIGKLLGDSRRSPGFADYISGTAAWNEVVRKDPLTGMHYTPPSKPLRSPSTLLARDTIGPTFATLRQRYQYIIVDSPPLAPVADARALAQIADCSIFVVRWMKTPRAIVQALLQRLASPAGAPVGVVLSRVDMNASASFEAGDVEKYYRKYKNYYARG